MNSVFMFRLFSVVLAVAMSLACEAVAQSKIEISGKVYDALTSKMVPGAKVEVLNSDSTVVGSGIALIEYYTNEGTGQLKEVRLSQFGVSIPKVKGEYTLRVTAEGYLPALRPLSLMDVGSRQSQLEVPHIYLKREGKPKDLDEVVVKASKVKFYNKGDTIIYNADAFQLPEGSMLDALVSQLPGVEIKDGGAIYVNGRYVESLLLNGKDFFKGNNEVMLSNLGAYLVKDVRVYEKGGNLSEMMGKNLPDDTQYVMDVKLKKDYMAGNLLNIIGTGGTQSRYLGKIFAMHYTNNSRITAYGNVNNLNDSDKPNDGKGQSIGGSRSRSGLTDTYRGGIDYFADNPQHTWEMSGNADFSFSKNTDNTDTYTTNFLPAGNTYDYAFTRPLNKKLGVSTSHSLRIKRDMWELNVRPSFRYNHDKSESESAAASFSKEQEGITRDMIAGLFSKESQGERESLINRDMSKDHSLQHGVEARLFSEFFYKIKKSSDLSSIWVEATFNDARLNRDNLREIAYGALPASSLAMRQFYKGKPANNFKFNVGTKYYFNIPDGTTGFLYNYTYDQEKKTSALFMLEARSEGELASTDFEGMEPILDTANSYVSTQRTNSHQVRPFYTQDFPLFGGKIDVKFCPELSFTHRRLDYARGMIDVTPVKNDFTVRIMDTYLRWNTPDYKWIVMLMYDRNPNLASLIDMVDMKDTTDPLNIQEGNPDLKNSFSNRLFLYFTKYSREGISHFFNLSYDWTENDLVRGYRYDTATGVRTLKTYNVNGNNNLSAGYNLSGGLPGVMRKFRIDNYVTYSRSQYANMIGENRAPQRQNVCENRVSEWLGISYNPEWGRIMPRGEVTYRHVHSASEVSDSFNAWEFNYGILGEVKTKCGFGFDTDITMSCRRGYSQKEMNDNCLLWNATASYTMLNGSLILSLKAHDILAQQKSISYSVSAQGRTERRFQTLPRYVALSLQYNFDFRPKREAK